jgi:hypothetical protein
MDLSTFDTVAAADRGAVLHLSSPKTGTPMFDEETKQPVTISLLGSDSKRYTDFVHKAKNKRIQSIGRMGRRGRATSEEAEAEQLELAVKCTVAWAHIIYKGQKLEFSEANVRLLYTEVPVVYDQVVEFMEDRSNYLGN